MIEDRIRIQHLAIEVTRRCNMMCDHCMRGEQQDIDFKEEVLWEFLSQIDSVGSLILTGGEPSLATDVINRLLFAFKMLQIPVENFDITTNAKDYNKNFVQAVFNWWMYCDDNEFSSLRISNDTFHCWQDDEQIKRLQAFKFTEFSQPTNIPTSHYARRNLLSYENMDMIIAEGRGKELGGTRYKTPDTYDIIEEENAEGFGRKIEDGTVYVNALGNIISGCDFSYESQEQHEICKATDNIWKEFKEQYGE